MLVRRQGRGLFIAFYSLKIKLIATLEINDTRSALSFTTCRIWHRAACRPRAAAVVCKGVGCRVHFTYSLFVKVRRRRRRRQFQLNLSRGLLMAAEWIGGTPPSTRREEGGAVVTTAGTTATLQVWLNRSCRQRDGGGRRSQRPLSR